MRWWGWNSRERYKTEWGLIDVDWLEIVRVGKEDTLFVYFNVGGKRKRKKRNGERKRKKRNGERKRKKD